MGRELGPEHSAKDLGVILYTNLTCDEHITKSHGYEPVLAPRLHFFIETAWEAGMAQW